jgi:hypothetical protein
MHVKRISPINREQLMEEVEKSKKEAVEKAIELLRK